MFSLPSSGNNVSWLAPPEHLMLKNNEVHVWRISFELTSHQVRMLEQLLSADELDKAERFYFQKDRDHFIVARGMLRIILGKYLRMNPDKFKFYYGPYGKPGLEKKTNPQLIQFNISHSHGLALCAFAYKREVGVDLEYIHEDHSFGSIAEHFFSKYETAALNSCPEHLRLKLFFKLWTRKEAFMKADGAGLALDLNQYEVLMGQNEMHIPRRPGNELQCADIWSLRDLDVGPDYAAALAVEGQGWQLKCWQWKDITPEF